MSDVSDFHSEEEQRLFRPFTRESLAAIEQRIAQENEKLKELEKKRADGEGSPREFLTIGSNARVPNSLIRNHAVE
ncbi:hypothetical protein RUM44_005795 [Polyplax serrata]|uniref:Uncharacterized protein n=1 Tax=Polyplax serrata TaxID=468196 RepID=A0ABR1AY36_POLSC